MDLSILLFPSEPSLGERQTDNLCDAIEVDPDHREHRRHERDDGNDDRDRDIIDARFRFGYQVSPGYSLFAE